MLLRMSFSLLVSFLVLNSVSWADESFMVLKGNVVNEQPETDEDGAPHAPLLAPRLNVSKAPIWVQLKTPIDVANTPKGSSFEGITKENYYFGKNGLPAGTKLSGTIISIKPSRRLGLPGYAQFLLSKAVFPSGHYVALKNVRTRKLHNPNAVTMAQVLESGFIFSAGSNVINLPLSIATGLSNIAVMGIGTATRLVEGTLLELTPSERHYHNYRGHNAAQRVSHGLLRGTGATGVYYLAIKPKNPNFRMNAMIPMRFEKAGLQNLFQAAANEPILKTATPLPL
jgi:hypothetical protein